MSETLTSERGANGRFAKKTPGDKHETPEERLKRFKALPVLTHIPLQIGALVREKATGTYGIAISTHELLGGTLQYSIQPESADGLARPEAWASDWQTIEVIGEGLIANVIKAPPCHIQLGERGKDIVTGFSGIVAERTTFMNGCNYVVLRGKPNTLTGEAKDLYTTALRVRRTGKGVRKSMEGFIGNVVEAMQTAEASERVRKARRDADVLAEKPPAKVDEIKAPRPPGGPSRNVAMRHAG